MKKEYDGYTVVPYPLMRKMVVDILELAHPKHMIHGFVEVDVTRARRFIREYEAETGGDLDLFWAGRRNIEEGDSVAWQAVPAYSPRLGAELPWEHTDLLQYT